MAPIIFVSGIGTGIGKTVLCAVLVEALRADYWKPIQAGNLESTDSDLIRKLISNPLSEVHKERYRLTAPLSPHAAATLDRVEISLSEISPPQVEHPLIVEGAGGLMVPLNQKDLVIDLIGHLKAPVILISKNYLGSINHTLLSIEALRRRDIPILGIIFNGQPTPASEEIIISRTGVTYLGSMHDEKIIDKDCVRRYALKFRESLDGIV